MNFKSERGAIIIEATLSLTFFVFAVMTLYTMYHVSLAQARIGTALNATAKELSQYAYIYDLTGLNEKQSSLASKGGAAQSILNDDLSQINDFYDAIGGIADSTVSIVGDAGNAESFLYYMLNEGVDAAKGVAVGEIARGLMKKNLGANPDKFLRGLGIENGMQGLSFGKSRFFVSGQEDEIILNVRYQITVIKLLDFDMKMNFELTAKTRAWVGS